MPASKYEGKILGQVLATLSGLKGVRHSFYLTRQMRAGLGRIERRYPSIGPLTVENIGLFDCLTRKHVACIVKDKSFRGPPHPTVVLVNEHGTVIGREILPGERIDSESSGKTIFLGKDFVIFVDRGSGRGARLVLPTVPFKEVEVIRGVSNVCSSSPSTIGDLFLREAKGLRDDPRLASILIGFDLARP